MRFGGKRKRPDSRLGKAIKKYVVRDFASIKRLSTEQLDSLSESMKESCEGKNMFSSNVDIITEEQLEQQQRGPVYRKVEPKSRLERQACSDIRVSIFLAFVSINNNQTLL